MTQRNGVTDALNGNCAQAQKEELHNRSRREGEEPGTLAGLSCNSDVLDWEI